MSQNKVNFIVLASIVLTLVLLSVWMNVFDLEFVKSTECQRGRP